MKIFFLLFCFLFVHELNAQLNPKTKWGNVSQAEWDYNAVNFEKEAGAVILFEEGVSTISNAFSTHVYRRIKILNEKGLEAANQEILLYSYKNMERIRSIKAQTINLENGNVQKYPIEKNIFFDLNLNEYYTSKKFTFPNVKVGSIIEFEYTIEDEKLYMIDAWSFQHDLPTLYSRYKIQNKSSLDYTSLMIGEKTVQFSKQKNAKTLDEWVLTNLPSFKTLSFLYNPEDMAERIAFQLVGYYSNTGNAYGGYAHKDAIKNWKGLTKEMNDNYNAYINLSFVKDLAGEIPNGKDEMETLQNIYDYFKQNYKWNRFTAIHPRISNRDLEKSRNGNVADLNLMLNSFLKAKGIDANLVLLSSRDNGKIINSYPYLGQFNLMVNLVSLKNGSQLLIDASYLEYDLGYMPLKNYNHYGLVLNEEANFISLYPLLSEFSSTQHYAFKDGKLNLVKTDKFNGYFKQSTKTETKGVMDFSPVINSMDVLMNETKSEARNSDDNYTLTRTTFDSGLISNAPFINVENPLRKILHFYKLEEETRERNLEFNFPFYYKADVIITIPEGYSAEIPANFKSHINLNDKSLIYFQSAEIKEGKLVLHVEFYMGQTIYSDNYKEVKQFFQKSNLDAAKTILLKKN